MRKILAVLMLVCALGLFAQIPAGTKSVTVLSGIVGDFLDDDDVLGDEDIAYNLNIEGGYFVIDGLEVDAILGLMGTTAEAPEGVETIWFTLGLGVLYHLPINPTFGAYAGAGFVFNTMDVGEDDNRMMVPIDLGAEIFLTPNNAIRLGGEFTLGVTEGLGNDLSIVLGTVHYF